MRRFPHAEQYQYPSEEGTDIVYLQALVWGKARNPVYFVMCKTQGGECLKFRFFPKREFIGLQVRRSWYSLLDSVWLLAGKTAPDGAVDLMAAFPLLHLPKDHNKEKLSLDAQILRAVSKKE